MISDWWTGSPFLVHGNRRHRLDFSRYLVDVIIKVLMSFEGICEYPAGLTRSNLENYVIYLLRQSRISYATVLTGLLYLLRLKQALKQSRQKILVGVLDVLVVGLMLSSKYLNDRHASNKAWSGVTGIALPQLNGYEYTFLSVIDYRLHVEEELFGRWTSFLLQPIHKQIPCPISTPLQSHQSQKRSHSSSFSHLQLQLDLPQPLQQQQQQQPQPQTHQHQDIFNCNNQKRLKHAV